jgi:sugar lactone lactonase YvrE
MKRRRARPELVYAARAELAEGPVWHDNALWWVDIFAGTLNRLDPTSGCNSARATQDLLAAAAPTTDGRWLIARRRELALLDWETGALRAGDFARLRLPRAHRFNDGKCDAHGRFWVGTLDMAGKLHRCGLFRAERGRLELAVAEVSLSNGLAWSPANDTFYHVDTLARRLDRFQFDLERGRFSDRTTLTTFARAEGAPDGITCDAEGHLWVACWGSGLVLRIDGKNGRRLEHIRVPAARVTSCAFGGPRLDELYITTAWHGLRLAGRAREPLAGSIFAIRTATHGPATHRFAIK